jgi:hypothetical protein
MVVLMLIETEQMLPDIATHGKAGPVRPYPALSNGQRVPTMPRTEAFSLAGS